MTVKNMKTPALSGSLSALRTFASKLARDRRGSAAVEFAIIVPMMLVMFFGTYEFSSAVAVDRKVSLAAQSLGDLASRYTNIVDADMTNFFKIGDAMFTPYPVTHQVGKFQATITELYIDPATGNGRAQWSKGDAPRTVGTTVTVPSDLVARDATNKIVPNQYLIYTEISYVYTPAVNYVMKTSVTLSDKSFMRPRLSLCVLYSASASGTCPTA
jgi:Flp pilus assembly protein TadG